MSQTNADKHSLHKKQDVPVNACIRGGVFFLCGERAKADSLGECPTRSKGSLRRARRRKSESRFAWRMSDTEQGELATCKEVKTRKRLHTANVRHEASKACEVQIFIAKYSRIVYSKSMEKINNIGA